MLPNGTELKMKEKKMKKKNEVHSQSFKIPKLIISILLPLSCFVWFMLSLLLCGVCVLFFVLVWFFVF